LAEFSYDLTGFASILLTLVGTWLLALGLRMRDGMSRKFRKDLDSVRRDIIVAPDVSQHRLLFRIGLGLITLGALLEIWTMYFR
jgi:hypothetical protein